MLPQILQCDLDGVRRIVAELETDPTSDVTIETVMKILEERCDGGRNIFHASVTMCQPTSNRFVNGRFETMVQKAQWSSSEKVPF